MQQPQDLQSRVVLLPHDIVLLQLDQELIGSYRYETLQRITKDCQIRLDKKGNGWYYILDEAVEIFCRGLDVINSFMIHVHKISLPKDVFDAEDRISFSYRAQALPK